MSDMFFDDWQSLLRAFVITVLGYWTLVFTIRISGKRTLSNMNAYDFIVTIALGLCLASILLNKNVALFEGIVVYSTLIALQFTITWLSVRFNRIKLIVGGQPVLLLYIGKVLSDVMKAQRITLQEIYVACRAVGVVDFNEVDVIVLETTGDITVISKLELNHSVETLQNIICYPRG